MLNPSTPAALAALLTLVVIAAPSGHVSTARGPVQDVTSVRELAAAVAAVARNLLDVDETTAALPMVALSETGGRAAPTAIAPSRHLTPVTRELDERLLDLPPPTC